MHEGHDLYQIEGPLEEGDTPGPFFKECAFGTGTGIHPDGMKSLTPAPCPVCHGEGTLCYPLSRRLYHACSRCKGSGKNNTRSPVVPCRACKGYGLVVKAP